MAVDSTIKTETQQKKEPKLSPLNVGLSESFPEMMDTSDSRSTSSSSVSLASTNVTSTASPAATAAPATTHAQPEQVTLNT